eukprot:7755099-Pyramimonas_sp.AAC.1
MTRHSRQLTALAGARWARGRTRRAGWPATAPNANLLAWFGLVQEDRGRGEAALRWERSQH